MSFCDGYATPSPKRGFSHPKFTITARGKLEKTTYWAGRVTIPTFEVFSNPTIRLSDISQRRFSLIDRVQNARNALMSQEDETVFKAIDNICLVDAEPIDDKDR